MSRSRTILFACCVVLFAREPVVAQSPELRGVWYTPRSGNTFVSQSAIAAAMDSLARNNFNVVYFNAWSRGFPLWRSQVYYDESGYYTDPSAGTRDILQEAITEAHRAGIEIEAWMEYGFAGWWPGHPLTTTFSRGPVFARHPQWLARDASGSDTLGNPEGTFFYWFSHNNPEAQNFLIQLHQEIAEKYDVDGIELDRIRYPSLNCGYDSVSIAIYKSENGGNPPPSDVGNTQWMRWRADKLVQFHGAIYDSLKAVNPHIIISNAPAHYSTSYQTYPKAYYDYLQDWWAWLNNAKLDAVQLQMYVGSSSLQSYIPSALYGVQTAQRSKVYAGIAVNPGGTPVSQQEAVNLITVTRNQGLQGNSVWYYGDLVAYGYFPTLKAGPYAAKVLPPYRDANWRPAPLMLNNLDPSVVDTAGQWVLVPQAPGYFGSSLVATATGGTKSVEYFANIPASAYYDVFAFVRGSTARTTQAPYDLYDTSGTAIRVLVNQQDGNLVGWVYLGTRFHQEGMNTRVLRVSNENIESAKSVFDGGAMLLLNRRLSPAAIPTTVEEEKTLPAQFSASDAFPNPFNPSTTILIDLPVPATVSAKLFDVLGREVLQVIDGRTMNAGSHDVRIEAGGLASGVYLFRLAANGVAQTRRLMLLR